MTGREMQLALISLGLFGGLVVREMKTSNGRGR
jgi:hypothetical protein